MKIQDRVKGRSPRPGLGKTHCPQGHPYAGDNLYIDPVGNKRCRTCLWLANAKARTAKGLPEPRVRKARHSGQVGKRNQNVTKTHCPQGHPYEGDNLYIDPKGAPWIVVATSDGRLVQGQLRWRSTAPHPVEVVLGDSVDITDPDEHLPGEPYVWFPTSSIAEIRVQPPVTEPEPAGQK